jgi:alanine racemase
MPTHRLITDVRRVEPLTVGDLDPPPRDIRPTRAEIDLGALVANAVAVKARVGGAGVLAVIKADGYGHGAVPAARALTAHAPIAGLAVSLAEEGIELRRAGIAGPILVMGGVYGDAHRDLVALDLTPVVSELADVEAFARAGGLGGPAGVHVKLDTGMARLGVRPEKLTAFLDGCARYPNIRVVGFMTHLASADSDPELTRLQLARFAAALPEVRARARGPLQVHAANTAGLFNFPESHHDAVRPGLALYRGVLRFTTAIAQLRDIDDGDPVSYGGHFRAAGRTRIATLPVGYADGYPRRLGEHVAGRASHVLVRGRRCPVVGAVCMDMLMVDVTALGDLVAVGDEVVLLGRQGGEEITAAELAERAGLIEYEIMCGISKRVPRHYRA